MSTVLVEEELLKIGRVYGSDDEEEEDKASDVPGGALDDDLLSDAGFEDGIFGDEEEDEDPFTSTKGSEDEEE
jgi:hypothetical protein